MKKSIHICSAVGLMLLCSWATAGSSAQGLEQQVSPDERERMHKDLDDASKAYPDHGRLEQPRHKLYDRFTQADLNEDNLISRDEAEQRLPGLANHFEEIDTDNDGTISREELQAAEHKIREERVQALKEAKAQQEQIARQETGQDAAPPAKKKHAKRHIKPPPADDNSDSTPDQVQTQ